RAAGNTTANEIRIGMSMLHFPCRLWRCKRCAFPEKPGRVVNTVRSIPADRTGASNPRASRYEPPHPPIGQVVGSRILRGRRSGGARGTSWCSPLLDNPQTLQLL